MTAMGKLALATPSAGVLTIDLAALTDNYRTLSARVTAANPAARTAAVVKADAYGLGVHEVAPALYAAGCRDFFVAHLSETVPVRQWLSSDASLYALLGLQPGEEVMAAAAGIVPVLNGLDQLAAWSALAKGRGGTFPAVLQVDTGMARLGLSPDELAILANEPHRLDGIELRYLMSHLACADEAAHAQNEMQWHALRRIATQFPHTPLSLANSGGLFLGAKFHGALARPGLALYGGVATDATDVAMRPVVRLDIPVVQTRSVAAGTRVGYGATHLITALTRLATLAAGYADGLPRSLGDKGAAYHGATRLPIVGRVSMDSMTIDITALPPNTLKGGSLVEIIGPHQSLETLAADAGTIAYEILTGLGHRYHRRYLSCAAQEQP